NCTGACEEIFTKALVRALAASTVRSNGGSIRFGDLTSPGELTLSVFDLSFRQQQEGEYAGGVGMAPLFVSRGRIADRDRGRRSCRALDLSVNATAPDRRGAEDAQLDPQRFSAGS